MAFAALLKKYSNNLYSQALAYTKSSAVAQDIVQDVFLKVWENRSQLSEVDRFDNYLFIMTRNRIITVMRKKIAQPLDSEMTELLSQTEPNAEQRLSLKQAEDMLEKGIKMLPPQRQQVFRLSRKEGLTYAEIAEQLGISTSTVKGHIVHALNFLRDHFRSHGSSIIYLLILIYSGQDKM